LLAPLLSMAYLRSPPNVYARRSCGVASMKEAA
jgi:hypothetical protein